MSRQNSRRIENVKVMLARGANGVGIESVEKTGTSGLVDTYTITLSDGSKITFDITNGSNGSSIASVEKTGTSGLVDIYTITLTDGSTSTFNVTNGARTLSYEKSVGLAYGASREIALDMTGYNYDPSDIIMVFINGLLGIRGTDWTLSTNPAKITVNVTGSSGNIEQVNIVVLQAGTVQPLTTVVDTIDQASTVLTDITIE